VERDWRDFRFLSGLKWIAHQSLFISFTFAFDRLTTATCRSRSGITKRWSVDRRDFCFRSRYFRFRPGGKPRVFQVNIRADSCLGPTLPGSRAEYHPCKLGLGDYFRSGFLRFRWVQGAVPGADAKIGLLVGSTKPEFSMGKRGFYGKNTELRNITPRLFIDQSTLISRLKHSNFTDFLHGNGKQKIRSRRTNRESPINVDFLRKIVE